ncbi:hypothetical protein GLOIN_2v1877681 [Rhizophagus irregularis DAOM 181602=DAOM 197198]|nr:hypothetical protein GLOIN_2v1877681 [Rhizophagus irregularis DAOM 181602=DAOM 197198]
MQMSINFADHFQNSTTTFMSAEKRDQILQPIKSFCALTQCSSALPGLRSRFFGSLEFVIKVLRLSRICDQSSSALFGSAVKVLRLSRVLHI